MGDAHEMACRELVQLVSDYLDQHLAEVDRRRFEAHLAACPDCVTIVEQFRATITSTGRIAQVAVPADTRDALLSAFRGWSAGPRSTT